MDKSHPLRIIGVCGRIGSGKSSFVSELLRLIPDAERIGTGDILKDELIPKGSLLSRSKLTRLLELNKSRLGPNFIKNSIRNKIEASTSKYIIVDGVRGPNVKSLMDEYPNSILVAIISDFETRYSRVRIRNEKEDEIDISINEFDKSDQSDHSTAIETLESVADVRIENNGSYEEFMVKTKKFTETLIK